MSAPRDAARGDALREPAPDEPVPRPASPWRPPTRRAFVAALGAAAAALAARSRGVDLIAGRAVAEPEPTSEDDRPRRLTTRWVGHC